ncbi:MAG: ParB/RepB/Spo0J family partition protein [Spirochaetia bacterium]|nr:ParB/RepB/Spo0J family partition protein [Spirochaetia bacterium]
MASKNKKLSAVAGIFEQTLDGGIRKIPIDQIVPSEDQPRLNKNINIENLAASIKQEGLLQPIVVTKDENKYVIIAGERRYRAIKLLKYNEIECRVIKRIPKDKYKLAVIENLQRENLAPIEEAFAYKKLKNYFNYTDSQLSEIVGKSRNYITEILSISELSEQWQKLATEANINSRNLLIQFAQAVKIGEGNTFINNYIKGSISTVKDAKVFLKTKKNPSLSTASSSAQEQKNPVSKKIENILLNSEWIDENKIFIHIEIGNLKNNNFTLETVEKKLLKSIEQIFSELN